MDGVSVTDFDAYFCALHGHPPYPWQRELAEKACSGRWPGAIDLPTGSGKTACIDIAIFALACQAGLPVVERTAPRRIFFCVNRRIIVDEAHRRARHVAACILRAEQDQDAPMVLCNVAKALRSYSGTAANESVPPLDVAELRGGIYRDNRWARSITQPTVICTTLDQLGSRLLFRGYGVSANASPIQAALIAYDSLILLDESHISEPFRQSLDHVARYLDPHRWAERSIVVRPMIVVPMTATPNDDMRQAGVIELTQADRHPDLPLLSRLNCSKIAVLQEVKDVASAAVDFAIQWVADEPSAVGIIVNRVATARAIYEALCTETAGLKKRKSNIPDETVVELVIGSMRPIDRDEQAKRLRPLVGPDRPKPRSTRPSIIIATQCLEVGADYDFDALVTECASLDALRQRFGRLNRAGREIQTQAAILAGKMGIKPEDKLDDDKPLDPIYGNAAARTWNWINHCSTAVTIDQKAVRQIDFGIDALNKLLAEHGESGRPPRTLLSPSSSLNAPVMMPAYVDLWCQTAPRPVPDPDVALFIHGPQGGEPDVQVCWRGDLIADDHVTTEHWPDIVALLPPTAPECMSVPISKVRGLFVEQDNDGEDNGDVLGAGSNHTISKTRAPKTVVVSNQPLGILWRGRETVLLRSPSDLRPGDTVVLPASNSSSFRLGHLPLRSKAVRADPASDQSDPEPSPFVDVAEEASILAKDRVSLRLHPSLRPSEPFRTLIQAAQAEPTPRVNEWRALLRQAAAAIADDNDPIRSYLIHLADRSLRIEWYPDGLGLVLTSRARLSGEPAHFLRSMDEGDEESSRIERKALVLLADHTKHVRDAVAQSLTHLPINDLATAYLQAADLHDLGKADERFQAMLRRSERTDAWLHMGLDVPLLAKSDTVPLSSEQWSQARRRAGLPDGFRHEMLSVQLAAHVSNLPEEPTNRDLVLHLIGSHHGHARPFAPVVLDDEMPDVKIGAITLSHELRAALVPPHRLDSGIAQRFWRLTRHFGWWGLAYLEAVLRLADQQASAAEEYSDQKTKAPADQHPKELV